MNELYIKLPELMEEMENWLISDAKHSFKTLERMLAFNIPEINEKVENLVLNFDEFLNHIENHAVNHFGLDLTKEVENYIKESGLSEEGLLYKVIVAALQSPRVLEAIQDFVDAFCEKHFDIEKENILEEER